MSITQSLNSYLSANLSGKSDLDCSNSPAPLPPALPDDFIARLRQEAADAIPACISQADRAAQLAASQRMLNTMAADLRRAPERIGPHTMVGQEGDHYHVHYYRDGARIHRFSVYAPQASPPDIWLFEFVCTLVWGFLDLSLSLHIDNSVKGIVWNKLSKNLGTMQKMQACIATGASSASILAVIDKLYRSGLIKLALSKSLSWWTLVSVLRSILLGAHPGGKAYELTYKLGILAVKLHWLVANMPPAFSVPENTALAA